MKGRGYTPRTPRTTEPAGSTGLPTPWVWTSGPQDGEKTDFLSVLAERVGLCYGSHRSLNPGGFLEEGHRVKSEGVSQAKGEALQAEGLA